MLKILALLLSSFLLVNFVNCQRKISPSASNTVENGVEPYDSTRLPIRLELLSEEVRSYIRKSHELDTSSYLIETRPVVFQIQGIENDQDQVRYTQPIHQNIEVLIYCVGELSDGKLVDYGWIENDQGQVIWKMEEQHTTYAGGHQRNVKQVESFLLPKGTYRLRYVSNASHANKDWIADPPEFPFYYGITVFNTQVIEKLRQEIEF